MVCGRLKFCRLLPMGQVKGRCDMATSAIQAASAVQQSQQIQQSANAEQRRTTEPTQQQLSALPQDTVDLSAPTKALIAQPAQPTAQVQQTQNTHTSQAYGPTNVQHTGQNQ